MRHSIPSTIANALTRAERAAGKRRFQICISAKFAASLPDVRELLIEIGKNQLRAQVDRRRDSGAVVLTDALTQGPDQACLFSCLEALGLGVGDHPEFQIVNETSLRLLGTKGQESLS